MSYIEFDRQFNCHRKRIRRRQRLVGILSIMLLIIYLVLVISGVYIISVHYIIPWLDGPRVEAAPLASGASVTIAPGDTLWRMARTHYPDMDPRDAVYAIRLLNPAIDPGRLQVGQVVAMPEVAR